MQPKTLLDTDILSALMRQISIPSARAKNYLGNHPQLTISLVTRFEILRGLKVKGAQQQLSAFETFCMSNQVLPITDDVVVVAADIYADLHSRGQLIPDADILIAATARHHGLLLATNNLRDFGRVSGLQIDNWLI